PENLQPSFKQKRTLESFLRCGVGGEVGMLLLLCLVAAVLGELPHFTKNELARMNGEDGRPVYISVRKHIFDVSARREVYGPGCLFGVILFAVLLCCVSFS